MASTKQQISCDDCSSEFEIKFDEKEHELTYCPFCGADLFWEDDDEEDDIYNEWSDPDNDDYE